MPWLLSPSCRAVPAPGVMLCAPLLPPLFSWLEILWRTSLCLRAHVCSLLGPCVAICLLLRCRLCLVLLGVAPFRSAPLVVLRPKPRWGRAWSTIWFFLVHISKFYFQPLCKNPIQHTLTSKEHHKTQKCHLRCTTNTTRNISTPSTTPTPNNHCQQAYQVRGHSTQKQPGGPTHMQGNNCASLLPGVQHPAISRCDAYVERHG
jgi:hypothetical protein